MIQEKWKSPVLWTAIASQVVSLLLLFGVIDLKMGETINQAVALVAQLLVLLGVFNNPTDKVNW